jgi:hypothetical protein
MLFGTSPDYDTGFIVGIDDGSGERYGGLDWKPL